MADPAQKPSEQRTRPCSIIPSYVLKHIAENSDVSPESRAIAQKTLNDIPAIHEARATPLEESLPPPSGPPVQETVPQHVSQANIDSEDSSEQAKVRASQNLASMNTTK